jgi:hypothetical protein
MVKFIKLYSQVMTEDGILIIEDVQSWDWIEKLKNVVPEDLKPFIKVYDLRPNKNREDFCSGIRTTNNLYSSKIGDKNLRDYILANLNYKAIGDFTKKENTNAFEKWWLKNAKAPMSADFKKFDQEYKKVVKVANDNFFDHRSFFKFFVDGLNQSRYLPKSLMATLKAESNLYMQILNRVMLENPGLPNKLNKPAVDSINNSLYEKTISKMIKKIPFIRMSDVDPLLTDYNYVENSRQNSEEIKYNSFYQQPAPELIKLNDILNSHLMVIIKDTFLQLTCIPCLNYMFVVRETSVSTCARIINA